MLELAAKAAAVRQPLLLPSPLLLWLKRGQWKGWLVAAALVAAADKMGSVQSRRQASLPMNAKVEASV